MAHKAPGKSHRKGITILELARMFPDEQAAREWFESILWPDGERSCPRCGGTNTHECKHAKMPYRCRDCRKYFSVKTGTVMAGSPIPLLKWLYAIYLDTTSLKGVSSMKLHRDLGVTQKTAWFMQQRIREAFSHGASGLFAGPVEVDETYVGGIEKNKHEKDKLNAGRGTVGKTAVVGAKDRETGQVDARVTDTVDGENLHTFVHDRVQPGAEVFTDEASAYQGLSGVHHKQVKHSAKEYVDGQIHTNGIESFWSMLKRAHKGTFHKLSPKHLQRYVNEFAGRHNIRECDTLVQMSLVATGLIGKFLPYEELIADNGLDPGTGA